MSIMVINGDYNILQWDIQPAVTNKNGNMDDTDIDNGDNYCNYSSVTVQQSNLAWRFLNSKIIYK